VPSTSLSLAFCLSYLALAVLHIEDRVREGLLGGKSVTVFPIFLFFFSGVGM
jgi:hypothetical protein